MQKIRIFKDVEMNIDGICGLDGIQCKQRLELMLLIYEVSMYYSNW